MRSGEGGSLEVITRESDPRFQQIRQQAVEPTDRPRIDEPAPAVSFQVDEIDRTGMRRLLLSWKKWHSLVGTLRSHVYVEIVLLCMRHSRRACGSECGL